jgi:hypothetical protein
MSPGDVRRRFGLRAQGMFRGSQWPNRLRLLSIEHLQLPGMSRQVDFSDAAPAVLPARQGARRGGGGGVDALRRGL